MVLALRNLDRSEPVKVYAKLSLEAWRPSDESADHFHVYDRWDADQFYIYDRWDVTAAKRTSLEETLITAGVCIRELILSLITVVMSYVFWIEP